METDAVVGEESYAEEQFANTQEQIADEQGADAGEQPADVDGTSDAAEPSKRKKHFSRNASRKKPKLSTISAMDKNAVMLLHEKFPGAIYSMVTQGGPVHQPLFTIEVKINDQTFTGSGTSKKKARLEAAESAVEALNLRVAGDVMVVKSGPDSEINFAADDLSLVMQESTGSGFVVSQPQAPAPVVKKVERIPEPIGKSPLLILNELRPGQQFEWRMPDGTLIKEKEEKKEDRTQKFTCVMSVDGNLFEEAGNVRKIIKARVAASALHQLFGLNFAYTSDGMPVYQGDDTDWMGYKVKEEDLQFPEVCNGKNPIQLLNELIPNLLYREITDDDVKTFGRKFVIAVEFENQTYSGEGSSKRLAKTKCAMELVNALETDGRLARMMSEKDGKVKKKPKSKKPLWNAEGKPGSSVIKLSMHVPDVNYHLVAQQRDLWKAGETMFTVTATVNGETFTGVGTTEVGARDQAADQALTKLFAAPTGSAGNAAPRVEADSSTPLTQVSSYGGGYGDTSNTRARGRGRGVVRGFQQGAFGGRGRGGRGGGGPSQFSNMGQGWGAPGPAFERFGGANRGFSSGGANYNKVNPGNTYRGNRGGENRGSKAYTSFVKASDGAGMNKSGTAGFGHRGGYGNESSRNWNQEWSGGYSGNANYAGNSSSYAGNKNSSHAANAAAASTNQFVSQPAAAVSSVAQPSSIWTAGKDSSQEWSSTPTYYSSIGAGFDATQPVYETPTTYAVNSNVEYAAYSGYHATEGPATYTTDYSPYTTQPYTVTSDSAYSYENAYSAAGGYLNYTVNK